MPSRDVEALRGEVVVHRYGAGTKSERDALMVISADGPLLLRRRNGPTFGATGLEDLIGKTASFDGTIVDNLLLVDRAKVIG